jgi:hypothetical protein
MLLILINQAGLAQKIKKGDKPVVANLEKHIRYLADDKL